VIVLEVDLRWPWSVIFDLPLKERDLDFLRFMLSLFPLLDEHAVRQGRWKREGDGVPYHRELIGSKEALEIGLLNNTFQMKLLEEDVLKVEKR
jgi:hypothetical protein